MLGKLLLQKFIEIATFGTVDTNFFLAFMNFLQLITRSSSAAERQWEVFPILFINVVVERFKSS